MKKTASPARTAAVKLLERLYKGILSDVEPSLDHAVADRRDLALCRSIVMGVLEKDEELTHRLRAVSKVPPERIRLPLLVNLKAALYQLLFLNRVPDYAVVDDAVEITRAFVSPRLCGFTNAVLRAAASAEMPPFFSKDDERSVLYSMPRRFIESFDADYGKDSERILRGFSERTADFIRINPLRTSFEKLQEVYGKRLMPCDSPLSALFEFDGDITADTEFIHGAFHFQNLSSQLCAEILGVREGESLLDCCAAPGGKSFTCAEMMNNRGTIDALDIKSGKTDKIKSGIARLGLDCISVTEADASVYDTDRRYDRVLCDVPCSGLGLIRNRPYVKLKREEEMSKLPELQAKIIDNCSRLVRPGGTLVYSTCTLRRAENEEVASRLLEHGFVAVPPDKYPENSCMRDGMLTVFPGGGYEGFFISRFVKKDK